MEDFDTEYDDSDQGKFNMAVATLMRINEILKKITEVSLYSQEDNDTTLHQKYKLVRQLYLASIPLIDKPELKKVLKDKVDDLNKEFHNLEDGVTHIKVLKASVGVDFKLDDVIGDIQETLQKSKYFMPKKSETHLF